ncbi:TonB-dependent receptor [Chryseobacterium rhizosphaerae]|uniref:TonB-dependent receptor n=1 Tax=Chryseobacterium rhizosphaerae TaxID=395937 RepID=UPI002358F9EB|nr:TonB-dependent receptor [Chryseobacterium rhizosphaerae]MDC8100424.1 carboxypeptidase-like regulatory domain-containing protein [Chryseobacterium rhizosphaerae]
MKLYQRIFIFLIFILSISLIRAQDTGFSVQGVVQDHTKQGLSGVNIFVENTKIKTQTDQNGNFRISYKKGEAALIFSLDGYKKLRRKMNFSGEISPVSIQLVADQAAVEEVIVHGKGKVKALQDGAFTVNAIDVAKLANTTADLNQVLNRTTGIKVRQQGGIGSDYNFSINGMSGKAVKFFIDGVPLEMLGKGVDLSTLPVNMADRVEIYKGVVPIHLSTDAMGGAVNIITPGSSRNYLDAGISVGSFNTQRINLNGQFKDDKTGIILRINSFYNHSDNNYLMKDMKIWNAAKNEYEFRNLKRFNDRYQSVFGMAEVGVENKSWADSFFVGMSQSLFDKQIQTGSNQEVVYGGVKQNGEAYNYFMKYKKANLFNNRLDVNVYAGFSKSVQKATDTLMRKYSWDGSFEPSATSEKGGRSIIMQHEDRLYSQVGATYRITEHHKLIFNYVLDYLKNTTFNQLEERKEDVPPAKMTKQILSMAYQQDFFNKHWTNIFFGKYYSVGLQKMVFDPVTRTDYPAKDNFSNWGYGFATTVRMTRELGIKGSFERSYRLVEPQEIFGDGVAVTSNMNLKPETSNNVNVGLYYNHHWGQHAFRIEGAGYIRDTKDFIYTVPNLYNSTFKYENLSNIFTRGLEGEVSYQYKRLLNVLMNVSYNKAYDNTKFANNSEDVVSATYKKDVPNQPWLFGNMNVSIGKDDWLQKDSRVELYYGLQMTEWFYKNWKSYGNPQNIPVIPRQTLHNIGISYSMKNGRYNLAFDVTNLSDALAYDNFKLQKQGRAFYIKFRYLLK